MLVGLVKQRLILGMHLLRTHVQSTRWVGAQLPTTTPDAAQGNAWEDCPKYGLGPGLVSTSAPYPPPNATARGTWRMGGGREALADLWDGGIKGCGDEVGLCHCLPSPAHIQEGGCANTRWAKAHLPKAAEEVAVKCQYILDVGD